MKRQLTMAVVCGLALACNKGASQGATKEAAPAAAAAPAGVSEKDLHGSWKVNVDEVKKLAESLDKAGKKEEAMGLAMIGATQMTLTFKADGQSEMKMINPFSDKGEAKVETSTWKVASAKGDTLALDVTTPKGVEKMQLTIKGAAMTMKDDKGVELPFTRE